MTIPEAIGSYIIHLKTLGRSPYTVKAAGYALRDFAFFLEVSGIREVEDLVESVLEAYQEDLAFRVGAKGRRLSLRSQAQQLSVVRGFTKYLTERGLLVHDPGKKLRLPRKPRSLPRAILTVEEVKRLLCAPDTRTRGGFRDRVVLEILYDTAIRRGELSHIKVSDLDLESGFVRISGKGGKERVVPLSGRVCELVREYLLAVRTDFLQGKDEGWLILNRWGGRMDVNGVWAVVKRNARLARIKKNVTTHTLRHTCATHMLRNGAPVRHLQEMLGHESLESTQIYTRVTINDLKKIHARYHPSGRKDEKTGN